MLLLLLSSVINAEERRSLRLAFLLPVALDHLTVSDTFVWSDIRIWGASIADRFLCLSSARSCVHFSDDFLHPVYLQSPELATAERIARFKQARAQFT